MGVVATGGLSQYTLLLRPLLLQRLVLVGRWDSVLSVRELWNKLRCSKRMFPPGWKAIRGDNELIRADELSCLSNSRLMSPSMTE